MADNDKIPATEQDTARLGKALMKLSFALLLIGAIASGVLGAVAWSDITVLYGFLIGSAAAVIKTLTLSSGIVKLFQRKRLTGLPEYLVSFAVFGAAVIGSVLISRHALIASVCAIAVPYLSFVVVLIVRPGIPTKKAD